MNAFVVNERVISLALIKGYSPIYPYLIQTETFMSDSFEMLKEELIEE